MDAREYAPITRLDTPPAGPPVTLTQRREAIRNSMRDVDLGDYDEEFVDWLANLLTDVPGRALVSLIERSRNAAVLKSWAEANRPTVPIEPRRWSPGNSGPGF